MTDTAATIGWISQNAQQMPGQPTDIGYAQIGGFHHHLAQQQGEAQASLDRAPPPLGRGLADYANPLNRRPVHNPPTLDGMFAPPLSPTETIRILRELLADAGRAIALRDLQISALRLQLNVATRERDEALSGAVAQPDAETFPASALRGGDGVPR